METKISAFDKENIKNLIIEKNVYQGYGLAHHKNRTLFVFKAVEGDIVNVQILYKKAKTYFAKITKLVTPSEFRKQKISCNAFNKCGGCDWLYISYSHQLDIKKRIIKELYSIEDIKTEPSEKEYYYRNKNFLPISLNNNNPIIGMYERNTHNVIPHSKCYLIPEIFNEIKDTVTEYLIKTKAKIYDEKKHQGNFRHLGIRINSKGEMLVILVTKNRKMPFTKLLEKFLLDKFDGIVGIIQNVNSHKGNRILGDEEKILFGQDYFYENLGDKIFKLNYASFFQVNHNVANNMYEFIKSRLTDDDIVIDAFSGVGSIGIFVSDKAKKVYLIENNKNAYDDLKYNIKNNEVTNCISMYGDANKEIINLTDREINTIIFDPPRKGIDKVTLDSLSQNIKKIIYVSCNPYTQKRDLDILKEKGFIVKDIKIFDMFPHTYHIETVIIAVRK